MDNTRRALLRSWLTKAASDLKSARVLGSVDDAPLDTAIYHCQQTAEKAVKAFLVSKELSPEKTHDIRRLTIEAAGHEPRFSEMMELAVSLTPYAWEFRYPDDLADTYPTREEFDEAPPSTPKPFSISFSPCSRRRRARENHRRRPPMSRVRKAVSKLLEGRSDANFDFDDLCFVLERAGFTRRAGRGSHCTFFRDGVAEIINLQPRGGQAKPYQVRQVRDLLRKYKSDIE